MLTGRRKGQEQQFTFYLARGPNNNKLHTHFLVMRMMELFMKSEDLIS